MTADRRVLGELDVLPVPAALAGDGAGYVLWLRERLARLRPAEIYVDVFPAGLLGELSGDTLPPDARLMLVARHMRWAAYRAVAGPVLPRFDTVFRVEPLATDQQADLVRVCTDMRDLELRDPPPNLPEDIVMRIGQLRSAGVPLWMLVHAGDRAELEELLAYARDVAAMRAVAPLYVVVSPAPMVGAPSGGSLADPDVRLVDHYPAVSLFSMADMLITGGGFNVLRQARGHAGEHLVYPFPRRYDDQYHRAAMYRAARLAHRG
jgi:hypothetical protein